MIVEEKWPWQQVHISRQWCFANSTMCWGNCVLVQVFFLCWTYALKSAVFIVSAFLNFYFYFWCKTHKKSLMDITDSCLSIWTLWRHCRLKHVSFRNRPQFKRKVEKVITHYLVDECASWLFPACAHHLHALMSDCSTALLIDALIINIWIIIVV